MSIATTNNKVTYQGNGATTVWPFSFTVLEKAHLRVILTDATGAETTLSSDYVVDLTNHKVTYPGYLSGQEPDVIEQPPVLPAGWKITLLRVVPYTQETALGERWPFTSIEAMADKTTQQTQQLAEAVERCIKAPVSSSTKPDDLIAELKADTNAAHESAASAAASLAQIQVEVDAAAQEAMSNIMADINTAVNTTTTKAANASASATSAATSETNAALFKTAAEAAASAANLSAQSTADVAFTTKAFMDADLAHATNVLALVTNDSTSSNNGIYIKLGASGSGSWQQSAYVPPVVAGSVITSSMAKGVVTTDKIADTAVLPSKILVSDYYPNLFNSVTVTSGYYVNTDGTLAVLASCAASDYIPVVVGQTYRWNNTDNTGSAYMNYAGAWYDTNHIFISKILGTSMNQSATAPTNAAYLRMNTATKYLNLQTVQPTTPIMVNLPWLQVHAANLAPGSVTENAISNGAVGTSALQTGGVTPDKLAANYYLNIFNPATVTNGYYVNTSGGLTALAGVVASDYISVVPGQTYQWTNKNNAGDALAYAGCWYDSGHNLLGNYIVGSSTNMSVVAPANAAYLRINMGTNYVASEVVTSNTNTHVSFNWLEILAQNIPNGIITEGMLGAALNTKINTLANNQVSSLLTKWAGKTANFLGDSITYGYSLPDITAQRFSTLVGTTAGFATVNNYGISGTRIANSTGSDTNCMAERYRSMADADIVFVMGSTNDYGHCTANGNSTASFGSFTDRVDTTFYGALHVLYAGLAAKYVGKQVVIMTPPHIEPNFGSGAVDDTTQNPDSGKALLDYVNTIKQVAQYYGLPVLDLFSISQMQPKVSAVKTAFYYDTVHPNAAGHQNIANIIINFLKTL